jgi:hypothetical protein
VFFSHIRDSAVTNLHILIVAADHQVLMGHFALCWLQEQQIIENNGSNPTECTVEP